MSDETVTGEVMTDDQGRRRCMWICPTQDPREHGGYVPSCVTENVPGHRRMTGSTGTEAPWIWGNTLDEAQKTAEAWNAKHGLTRMEAWKIIGSSMFT